MSFINHRNIGTISELEVKTFRFTWKIHDFSKIGEKRRDAIYSPIFKTKRDASVESLWRLTFYPYGNGETTNDHLSWYIELITTNDFGLRSYIFRLSLLDNDGNDRLQCTSGLKQLQMSNNAWGWSQFCTRDTVMNERDTFLIDDTLKIVCCITLNPYSKEECDKGKIMLYNYETLFLTASFSDLEIVIGEKKIKAHKNILSARSKVFSAMFQHDMIEQNTSTIAINDVSYQVMIELLRFLYCGKVRNIKKLANPLLIAADKYDISSLKATCERILFENLQEENACEILLVADGFNCTKLKSETIDFIIKNIKAITQTSKFKKLKVSNAELLEEILCKIAEG